MRLIKGYCHRDLVLKGPQTELQMLSFLERTKNPAKSHIFIGLKKKCSRIQAIQDGNQLG